MMQERKQWLKAVEDFRNDSATIIECPKCNEGILFFMDVAFDDNDIKKGGERIIECNKCGKFEIVLYRNPPQNWYTKNKS